MQKKTNRKHKNMMPCHKSCFPSLFQKTDPEAQENGRKCILMGWVYIVTLLTPSVNKDLLYLISLILMDEPLQKRRNMIQVHCEENDIFISSQRNYISNPVFRSWFILWCATFPLRLIQLQFYLSPKSSVP